MDKGSAGGVKLNAGGPWGTDWSGPTWLTCRVGESFSPVGVVGPPVRIELRPLTAIAVLFAVVVAISGGSVVTSLVFGGDDGPANEVETVTLDDGSELWPYTSRAPSVEERTLGINLVVYDRRGTTERLLRASTVGEWEEVDEEEQDIAPAEAFNETTVAWGAAAGAERFVYVRPPGGNGRWLAESYQLRDGDYLGTRYHVRAYRDPSGDEWTAMQAHIEHWDWFHLRHTVHSTEEAQSYVESEYVDAWYVADLSRERFGNDQGADNEGWVTVVHLDEERIATILGFLGPVLLGVAGVAGRRSSLAELWADESVREATRAALVVGSIVGLYLAVRFGAIGVERLAPWLSPKVVIAVFYPVVVAGLPVAAYLSSRKLDAVPAFAAGSLAFGLATFLDYWYLAVATLPLETFVHRAALAIAVGFVAAGASRTARAPDAAFGLVRTGVLLWLVAVALPLMQFF